MSRYRAASIHLLISIAVFSLFLSLVYFIWYAYPLFHTEGVTSVVTIMAAVDIVLGPLLTLLLFKSGKKGLVFDLCIIAAIQVSALLYGGYTVYSERPVYLVHSHDKFEVVGKAEIKTQTIPDNINTIGFFEKPEMFYQARSENSGLDEFMFSFLAEKDGPKRMAADVGSYEEYDKNIEIILEKTEKVSTSSELIQAGISEDLHFAIIKGKRKEAIVLLDSSDASVISFLHESELLSK